MSKTRTDFIRAKVEELKAFDIVHELRTINTEAQMGVDVVPLDAVVEKLKPAFDVLASAIEGLLVAVEALESQSIAKPVKVKTYEGEIVQILTPAPVTVPIEHTKLDIEFWYDGNAVKADPAL